MKLSTLSESKFAKQVNEMWKEGRDASRAWRSKARDDYKFYSGDQWTTADERHLKDSKRPIVTFNRVKPVIDAIAGSELVNRQAVRYLPQSEDDGGKSEMFTETARWVRQKSDAEDEESHSFQDTSICGMGWTETWIDFETELDGQIKVERFTPLEAYWDAKATKQNLSDAKWVGRKREVPKDELKERFPKKRLILGGDGLNLADPPVDSPHETVRGDQYQAGNSSNTSKRGLDVLQFQWWERAPIFRAFNPETQEVEEVAEENVDLLQSQRPDIEIVRQSKKVYWQALLVGKTVLTRTPLHAHVQQDGTKRSIPGFTLRPVTGFYDEDKGEWFGVMRAMKDPQRWSNKFFSQIQDIINSQAKGGLLAEQGAFVDQKQAERDWAKTDAIVWASDGAIAGKRITERPQASLPSGLERLMGVAMTAIRDVAGVNIEFLGMADRTQAGVTERQRVAQGMVVLATLFNALRRYRKEQGRVLLHMIRMYVPKNRVIRVTGSKHFKFLDDPSVVDFDIIVDQSPSSPNFKQEVWASLREVLPVMLKAGIPLPPALMKFLPLPDSVVEELLEFIQSQQPSEEDQKIQQAAKQLEIAGMQADVALKQAQAIAVIMKAQAAGAGVEAGIVKALIDAETKGEATDVERGKVIVDSAKAGLNALIKSEDANGQRTDT